MTQLKMKGPKWKSKQGASSVPYRKLKVQEPKWKGNKPGGLDCAFICRRERNGRNGFYRPLERTRTSDDVTRRTGRKITRMRIDEDADSPFPETILAYTRHLKRAWGGILSVAWTTGADSISRKIKKILVNYRSTLLSKSVILSYRGLYP